MGRLRGAGEGSLLLLRMRGVSAREREEGRMGYGFKGCTSSIIGEPYPKPPVQRWLGINKCRLNDAPWLGTVNGGKMAQ
mgnify:CR=1 FL=1